MAVAEARVPTAATVAEPRHDVVKDKSVTPHPPPQPVHKEAPHPPHPAAAANKTPDPSAKKTSLGPTDRDVALANVEKEKSLSFIKAWEESEKTKVENKAQKQLAAVASWENTKKATVESKLKTLEEQLEKKKGDYVEKTNNKVALIHKEAEEKRAMVAARRGEEMLKAEEMAAKHRATGSVPKKLLGFLGR